MLTLRGSTGNVLLHHASDLIVEYDGIEGPSLVRTSDFLTHGCEEALWVEESSHPEAGWSSVEEPRAELVVAVQEVSEPESEGGRLPGNPPPRVGNTRIIHVVQGIAQVLRHDDGTVDGQFQVSQSAAHFRDDLVEFKGEMKDTIQAL